MYENIRVPPWGHRYWGRQKVARVSNTQTPRLSIEWMDPAKVAHFHVSLNTLRPGLEVIKLEFIQESKTCALLVEGIIGNI